MTQDQLIDGVAAWYDAHPINEQQIVDKLQRDGHDLENLTEEILLNYDQDHYGGIEANDALAQVAGIDDSCHVLDLGSGMGGPARYQSHRTGCRVTGLDLTASRVAGARHLTELAGLADRVSYEVGNALDMPFEDATFDVIMSQEAFCHIPGKTRLVEECARVARPGGRFVFTDILVKASCTDAQKARLHQGMSMNELNSEQDYRSDLERSGFEIVDVYDLSRDWCDVLAKRLMMYRSLKDQTVEKFGEAHFRKWDEAYAFFVGLYQTGELGGARFCARRKAI